HATRAASRGAAGAASAKVALVFAELDAHGAGSKQDRWSEQANGAKQGTISHRASHYAPAAGARKRHSLAISSAAMAFGRGGTVSPGSEGARFPCSSSGSRASERAAYGNAPSLLLYDGHHLNGDPVEHRNEGADARADQRARHDVGGKVFPRHHPADRDGRGGAGAEGQGDPRQRPSGMHPLDGPEGGGRQRGRDRRVPAEQR